MIYYAEREIYIHFSNKKSLHFKHTMSINSDTQCKAEKTTMMVLEHYQITRPNNICVNVYISVVENLSAYN